MSNATHYFIAIGDDNLIGPLTSEEVVTKYQSKEFTLDHFCSVAGGEEWSTVREMFPELDATSEKDFASEATVKIKLPNIPRPER
ncbi:MAG: hypothetical protein AAF984_01205 [Verrucomicrobiota bacterium]